MLVPTGKVFQTGLLCRNWAHWSTRCECLMAGSGILDPTSPTTTFQTSGMERFQRPILSKFFGIMIALLHVVVLSACLVYWLPWGSSSVILAAWNVDAWHCGYSYLNADVSTAILLNIDCNWDLLLVPVQAGEKGRWHVRWHCWPRLELPSFHHLMKVHQLLHWWL